MAIYIRFSSRYRKKLSRIFYIKHIQEVYLFGFNSCSIFFTETEFCDGNIVKNDVEVSGSFCQFLANKQRNLLTLGDQLGCIEFGDHTFKNFIADGG